MGFPKSGSCALFVPGSSLSFDRRGQSVRVAYECSYPFEAGAQFLDVTEPRAAGCGQKVRGLIEQTIEFHRVFFL
jgi:hypothetical protein